MFIIKIFTIQKFIIIYRKEIDIRLIDIKEKKKKYIYIYIYLVKRFKTN